MYTGIAIQRFSINIKAAPQLNVIGEEVKLKLATFAYFQAILPTLL